MSNNEVVIKAKKICKTYRHYRSNMQKIQFLLLKRDAGIKEEVLKNVSFEIKKGEKVGILGHQQSGKTTLMRIIAGVIRPDSGKIRTTGSITPILDVRLGFEASLTGKDNYVMMSSVLGRSSDEIRDHEASVFEFAQLTEVKDEPTKTYNKGAAGRLGFATATEMGGDIILYDAGFAFGSNAWNAACKERMKELISGDTTFVMSVKKAADAVNLCERGIVLEKGEVVFDGSYDDALAYYKKSRKTKSVGKEGIMDETAEDDSKGEGQYED